MAYQPNLVQIKHTFDWVGPTGEADVQELSIWGYIVASGTPPDWATDLQTIADNARTKWIAEWPVSWFSPAISGKMITAYQMDSTLHALSSAVSLFGGGSSWVGTGSDGLPPQDTVVVTTYCDDPGSYVPHRARRRGRFYLPVMDDSMLSASGLVAPTHVTGILGAAVAYMTDLHTVSLTGGNVFTTAVISRAGVESNAIGWVGVGEVVDTQRRRRNKLVENYSTASL